MIKEREAGSGRPPQLRISFAVACHRKYVQRHRFNLLKAYVENLPLNFTHVRQEISTTSITVKSLTIEIFWIYPRESIQGRRSYENKCQ